MELHDSLKVSSVCSYCVHLFLELIKKKIAPQIFLFLLVQTWKLNPTAFYTRFHFIVVLPISTPRRMHVDWIPAPDIFHLVYGKTPNKARLMWREDTSCSNLDLDFPRLMRPRLNQLPWLCECKTALKDETNCSFLSVRVCVWDTLATTQTASCNK